MTTKKEVIFVKKIVRRCALTGGIVWGATMFVSTWAGIVWGWGNPFLTVMASIYPGYQVTPIGSLIGAVYGFFDVFLCVYIIMWVYKMIK